MKKSVAVFLVVMFVVAFLSPLIIPLVDPPEPVDWEPLNVRQTYEVQWKITYDDGSRNVVWEECSEESYNVFKGFLEGGGFDG
jgi:hypothetical protein